MAEGYAIELVGVRDGSTSPSNKSDGRVQGARVRRSRATLSVAADTTKSAISDTNVLFTLPKGCAFMGIEVQSDDSQTTAKLAFGTADAPTSLSPAIAYGTTAEAVVKYGTVEAKAAAPSADDREIIVTISVAALTADSTLVIDLLYSGR